ncbi:MAG: hypothetical protein IKM20_06300 [Erysipelotrichales bacterium]|nr:hypothetical protein [Erysipelotrichales bacterium]
MRKTYKNKLVNAIAFELRENKSSFIVYTILRALVIVVAILQFLNKNYENVFMCVLTLILFIIPSIVQMTFKIDIPKELEIIIYIFIFSAEILGEINNYYVTVPYWDKMLHTINGFLAAAIGFSLVHLLNENEKLEFDLSPIFLVMVSFCFSMTIGIIWEFLEFTLDMILGTDCQKDAVVNTIRTVALSTDGSMSVIKNIDSVSVNGNLLPIQGYLDIGLIDTMQDLFVNFIGAGVFAVFGFLYLKHNERGNIVTYLMPLKKKRDD